MSPLSQHLTMRQSCVSCHRGWSCSAAALLSDECYLFKISGVFQIHRETIVRILPLCSCLILFSACLFLCVYISAKFDFKMSTNCSVCSVSVTQTRKTEKIKCSQCMNFCHAHCVKMSKSDIDFIVEDNKSWFCPPCITARRMSMSERDSEEDIPMMSKIVQMLKEAKNERKKWRNSLILHLSSIIIKWMIK